MNIGRFNLTDEQLQVISIFPVRVLTAVVRQYQSQINNLNDADHVVRYLKKVCHDWWKNHPLEDETPQDSGLMGHSISHKTASKAKRYSDGRTENWIQQEIIYLQRTIAGLNGSDHAQKYKDAWGVTPQERLQTLEIYNC